MANRTKMTDRAREIFLSVLADTCNVTEACRNANMSRTCAYEHRSTDAEFAAAWKDAEEQAADRLEREAWRRAVEGTDKPVIHQGVITTTYKEYSDRMLEILLKGHKPKYRDKVALTGGDENDAPIRVIRRVVVDPASDTASDGE